MRLIKTVVITTDAEGGSARPETVASPTRVFVLYLGNIATGSNRSFNLKIYDRDLDRLVASRVLVSTTPEYGGPTDIRVTSDGQFLYAFYETHNPSSPTTATTYLWGAKYSLDDSFERLAYTSTPIASSKPMSELQDGGELLDDPAPLLVAGRVFVITRLRYSLSRSGRTVYRVRELSADDLTKLAEFDLDLSDAADGRGRVSSLLFWNGRILMGLPTTVSDQGLSESNDDGALSDVLLVRMRENWTFEAQNDVRVVAAEPNDRENYVSGLKAAGEYVYLTYKQSLGSPPSGEHVAWIKVFDEDLNLVHAERVRSTVWGPGGGEMRPSLEVAGNRVFSGQSAGESLGRGNAEIWVYEISPPGATLTVNR